MSVFDDMFNDMVGCLNDLIGDKYTPVRIVDHQGTSFYRVCYDVEDPGVTELALIIETQLLFSVLPCDESVLLYVPSQRAYNIVSSIQRGVGRVGEVVVTAIRCGNVWLDGVWAAENVPLWARRFVEKAERI